MAGQGLTWRGVLMATVLLTAAVLPSDPGVATAATPRVRSISSGGGHTCAVRSNGTAWCWGSNGYGQLGDSTTTERHQPVRVKGLTGVTAISAGNTHSCALRSDGTAWCWGDNQFGQLGDGTWTDRHEPVRVMGLTDVTAISATFHTCARTNDGTAWCWGYNGSGELGDGTTDMRNEPVRVAGLGDVTAISVGTNHTCALRTDRSAWCWGTNARGQLGDGTRTPLRVDPVRVIGLTSGTAISAGDRHSCVRRSGGNARCWGWNVYGQLGDGTDARMRRRAVRVAGLTGVRGVSVGSRHSCARRTDRTAWCWGANWSGQLGDGTTTERHQPVRVNGLSDVTAISAGRFHSCARTSDGAAWCWGENTKGQLGDGTTTERHEPVRVVFGG